MNSNSTGGSKQERRSSLADAISSGHGFFSPHSNEIKSAVINTSVHILGIAILSILYFNYLLLQPYLYIFLWSLAISIPLHSLKNFLVSVLKRKSNLEIHENPSYSLILTELSRLFLNVNTYIFSLNHFTFCIISSSLLVQFGIWRDGVYNFCLIVFCT